jgi:hypothetical protein
LRWTQRLVGLDQQGTGVLGRFLTPLMTRVACDPSSQLFDVAMHVGPKGHLESDIASTTPSAANDLLQISKTDTYRAASWESRFFVSQARDAPA